MHESHGGTDLLTAPEHPDPTPRPARRSRRRGLAAVLVAAVLVLLCVNGAVAYFGYRISVGEQVEQVR